MARRRPRIGWIYNSKIKRWVQVEILHNGKYRFTGITRKRKPKTGIIIE